MPVALTTNGQNDQRRQAGIWARTLNFSISSELQWFVSAELSPRNRHVPASKQIPARPSDSIEKFHSVSGQVPRQSQANGQDKRESLVRPVQHEPLQLRHGTASFPNFFCFATFHFHFHFHFSPFLKGPFVFGYARARSCVGKQMEDDNVNEKQALCTQNGWSFAPFAMEPAGSIWHDCPYNVHCNDNDYTQWCFSWGDGLLGKSGMCFAGG